MADHIIVIFDRSGSMGQPFHANMEAAIRADFVGEYEVKIQEAQERLIAWLEKSQFEVATIIPFHSTVEPSPLSASLSLQKSKIIRFIRSLTPSGSTNLASALRLAIDIGLAESRVSYVKYLIVTDGLSDTTHEDVGFISQIPKTQSVDGILIDPTGEGENHLRSLCVRGHYISVMSPKQLDEALTQQGKIYDERLILNRSYRKLATSNKQLLNHLDDLEHKLDNHSVLQKKLKPVVFRARSESEKLIQFKEEIVDQAIPPENLVERYEEVKEIHANTEALVQLIEGCIQQVPKFKISISHPKLLSKRLTSPFLIYIYPVDKKQEVATQLADKFQEWGLEERIYDSDLTAGITVIIKLSSPDIKFSDEDVVKKLQHATNHVSFVAHPSDSCFPGKHTAILSVRDKSSDEEYGPITFPVEVVDFVFDHISRPLISKLASFILGIGAFATFILTLMGQIDTTFGLTSGTTAGTLAATIYARFFSLFRRANTTINQP